VTTTEKVSTVCGACGADISNTKNAVVGEERYCPDCAVKMLKTKPAVDYSTTIAFVLSGFPGAGHMYLGLLNRGLSFMLAFIFSLHIGGVFGVMAVAIVFYAAFDALRLARAKHAGETITDVSLVQQMQGAEVMSTRSNGAGPLVFGAALIAVGLVLLLRNFGIYLPVDLLWPILPMGLGGWLIASYFQGNDSGREL
jgi:hypothetical protein